MITPTITQAQITEMLHTQALMHIAIVEMGQRLNRVETRLCILLEALGHGDKINNQGVKR